MLDQRRRRWANIETALGELSVFAGTVQRAMTIDYMSLIAGLCCHPNNDPDRRTVVSL